MSQPYQRPDRSDLRARFPNFVNVPDGAIDAALALAITHVDDDWVSQVDFSEGALLYAAHHLTLDGHGGTTEAELISSGTSGFAGIKTGSLQLSGRREADRAMGDYAQTQYGRRFYALARRNRPGPVVAA